MNQFATDRLKSTLLAGAAFSSLLAGAASAQTADGGATNVQGDQAATEIVVHGQRAADRNAIQTKRAAPQILDAVSADDIGRIADFSIGDALKRISGVNTYNYQGEPRFATIRGFDANFNTTTLDGLQIASPDNQNQNNGGGRQFYLESLPSNIASRIEVYKTSTPDMAGHSLGGSINFAIPSAFDFRGDQFRIKAEGGSEVLDGKYGGDKPTYEGEVFATHRFGSHDQFGVMFSASYWRRDQWIPDDEQGSADYWYSAAGQNTGTAYVGAGPVGSQRAWMLYDDSRTRESVLSKLDWRPNDRLSASATVFYFKQNETAIRHDNLVSIGAGATDTNQTATTGTLAPRSTAPSDIATTVRTYALYFDRQTYGTQGDVSYAFSDKLKFDLKGAYSDARFYNPQVSDTFGQNGLSYNYQITGSGFFVTPTNQNNYNNLSLYSSDTHFVEHYHTLANHLEVKSRLGYNMDAHDAGFGVETGVSFIRNTHSESYNQTTWSNLPFSLATVVSSDRPCSTNCNDGGMYLIDSGKLQSQLSQYLSTVTPVFNTAAYYKDTFGVTEDVSSGYVMTRYVADRWNVIGGLRLEHTDMSTFGFQNLTSSSGTNYVPITAETHYDNWLPSITANYDLQSDMQLRAAYSRTIGRPKFTDEGLLGGSLNISNINSPVLATGNPQLKPSQSDNFDVSYEWYFDRASGLFSVGLFYKSVADEIYLLGQTGLVDIGGGQLVQGTITKPVNSGETTTVKGLEFNFVKYLTFLPGPLSHLGVSANGVFDRTRFPLKLQDGTPEVLSELPNQAPVATNLALFYETSQWHARIAWNHTGALIDDRQLGTGTTSAANFYKVRWDLARDYVDASLSYDINARLTARIDVTNLLRQGTDSNIGLNQEIPVARYKIPTGVMAGLSYRF